MTTNNNGNYNDTDNRITKIEIIINIHIYTFMTI